MHHIEGDYALEDVLLDEMGVVGAGLWEQVEDVVVAADFEAVELVPVEDVVDEGLKLLGQLHHSG